MNGNINNFPAQFINENFRFCQVQDCFSYCIITRCYFAYAIGSRGPIYLIFYDCNHRTIHSGISLAYSKVRPRSMIVPYYILLSNKLWFLNIRQVTAANVKFIKKIRLNSDKHMGARMLF